MARQLWFLRHGEAEPHGARPDPERELTELGRDEARLAGRALAALEIAPAMVLTSPKVRARDTALLACESLGIEPVELGALSDDFDADQALALLGSIGAGQRLLLVGHEPYCSRIVHDLTGARIALRTGGLVGVRIGGGQALLQTLLRPRETRSIG